MNPSQILSEMGKRPHRGQHFLQNDRVVEALVEAGEVDNRKTVEIGGGLGAITGKLLERTGDLTVYEKDREFARYLEQNFPEASVVAGDFLESEVSAERCVSNIPFNLSSEIVEKLGEAQIQSALVVQKELAEKAVADPGDPEWGFFSFRSQFDFVPVKLREVDSSCFYPEPEVDAAILKLYPGRHRYDQGEDFLEFARAMHLHGKKKLRNAIVDARNELEVSKPEAKTLREGTPHREKRVNELSVRELEEAFQHIQEDI